MCVLLKKGGRELEKKTSKLTRHALMATERAGEVVVIIFWWLAKWRRKLKEMLFGATGEMNGGGVRSLKM